MLEVLVTVACCGIKFLKTSIFNPPTPPIHAEFVLLDGAEKEEWEDFASHVAKSPCAKVLDTVEKAQRDLNSPKSLLKLAHDASSPEEQAAFATLHTKTGHPAFDALKGGQASSAFVDT